MTPEEYLVIKREMINAILLGYGREDIDAEEETDLVLAELEKNKAHQGGHFEYGGSGGLFGIRSNAVRSGSDI